MSILRPYLAVKSEDSDIAKILAEKGELWGFVKIDGVRAVNTGEWSEKHKTKLGRLLSRSMKKFPNEHVNKLFGGDEWAFYDGEMTVTAPNDPMACRAASAAVATIKGEAPFRWFIFDHFGNPDLPYRERFARIPIFDPSTGAKKLTPHVIRSMADFRALEERAVTKQGYEGIILRDPNAKYKEGRSTLREGGMMKIKRFVDGEAEIIGFEEEVENTNEATLSEIGTVKRSSAKAGLVPKGTLGAFKVRDLETGVEFSVGGGFTADERMLFWASRVNMLGRTITYKHLPTGAKDKPRHTGFVCFREAFDMDPNRLHAGLPDDVRNLI